MKNRVKQFLEARGLTAYQFIKETGIAPATGYKLAKDESHLPAIRVLEVICDTYRVQPGELVEWVDESQPEPKRSKAKVMQPEPIATVERDADLDYPIEDLQVSVRTYNALRKACYGRQINTVRDLVSTPKAEIMAAPGFGKSSLDEICEALKNQFDIHEWK